MIGSLVRDVRNGVASAAPIIARQAILIALSLVVASIVLVIAGFQPLSVATGLWRGITSDIGGTLRWSTPLILTGLAASVAFRAKVWNIGIDGQLYLGGFAAAWVGLNFPNWPHEIALPAAIALGIIVGMLWGLLPGVLRVQFGANEIVTTILLNFVAFLITDYFVLGPFADSGPGSNTFSSPKLPPNVFLDRIMTGSQANVGLYIAIVLAVLLFYVMYRTTIGYELKVVGSNPWFAQYGGISVKRVILMAMAISGAIGGLAGVEEILGVNRRFAGRFSTGLGFDGIVVAILARNHPIGVILAGLFFGALRNGAANMERVTNVPRAGVEIVQAIIVLVVSADFAFTWWRGRKRDTKPAAPTAPLSGPAAALPQAKPE